MIGKNNFLNKLTVMATAHINFYKLYSFTINFIYKYRFILTRIYFFLYDGFSKFFALKFESPKHADLFFFFVFGEIHMITNRNGNFETFIEQSKHLRYFFLFNSIMLKLMQKLHQQWHQSYYIDKTKFFLSRYLTDKLAPSIILFHCPISISYEIQS